MFSIVDDCDLEELNLFLNKYNLFQIKKEEVLTNPFLKLVVYKDNLNNIIGYLNYSIMYDKAELNQIFIADEQRGKGSGTALMEYFMNDCSDCENITLEVKRNNTVAINLYEKFNFHVVAVRKYYYGSIDGLLMMYKRGE